MIKSNVEWPIAAKAGDPFTLVIRDDANPVTLAERLRKIVDQTEAKVVLFDRNILALIDRTQTRPIVRINPNMRHRVALPWRPPT